VTEFVLVRHGETEWHADNRYAGRSDVALTERGLRQADALAEWASRAGLDAVVTSGLSRARRTAAPAARAAGLVAQVDERLVEVDYGDGDGRTREEMHKEFPEALAAFLARPASCPFPHGESGHDAVARAMPLNVPLAMNPRSRRPLARASAGEDRDGMAHVPVHHLEARLETPRVAVAPSLRAAARAFGDDGMDAYLADVVGLADAELPAYVDGLRADRLEDSPRPRGLVPATHLWWVAGVEYLGRVHLRHRLTPALWEVGGHLGYHVVPPHRRRGHATAMLAETLPFAAALGIDELLVTCDVDNEASRRVIEANGGELEDRRGVKLRFWVPTSASG